MLNHCQTLSEAITKATQEGYDQQFKTDSEGIQLLGSDKSYGPDDLTAVEIKRFEGETNPADAAELLVLETTDGIKGTLVMSYGAKNDQNADLIRKIPVLDE